jgi:hypothetical protein
LNDGVDDGWRKIADDPAAPQTGFCWLADEPKTMAWESRSGVNFQPLSDVAPYWWKETPGGMGA